MSAGNFNIRRNASDTTAVPAAGSYIDASWDTLVKADGSIVTYSNPNLQLDTGIYLIMYSEQFYTADTTNNERVEIQGELHLSGTGVIGGYSSGYIRKSSGDQSCTLQGYAIIEVASDNTDYFIQFYRTDNSTSGTVNRLPGYGGISVLQLDDAHNFGLYTAGSSEATTGTTVRTLLASTNDRQDTGFSNSLGIVTITTAGRYFVTYSLDVSQSATGREVVSGFIEKNSTTEVIGTRGYCYLRGSDGTQDGAVTWAGIIDVDAGDTLRVQWSCPTSATITMPAGGGAFQIWQIPSGADEFIAEATTGDYNANADFDWDTNPHIDTGSFTHTVGTSEVVVDQNDHLLMFATWAQVTDSSTQRATPLARIKNNGIIDTSIAGGAYHRNSSTSNFSCGVAGLVNSVKSGNSIAIHTTPNAAAGALANTKGQLSILSLESIWSYSYTFAASITDFNTTETFNWGAENVVITGDDFEASQSTGKVEIWSDAIGTIKTEQTVDSWSTTSIQIDTVRGSLPNDSTVYIVVTPDSNPACIPFPVTVGVPSYFTVINALSPSKFWPFQNSYLDTVVGTDAAAANVGPPGFVIDPLLARGDTHSVQVSTGEFMSPPDISEMNTSSQGRRYMGGWIQLTSVSQILAVIYEEGAQVNNIAFLIGFGNSLVLQVANASDDYVQAYSDIKLIPDRPYHILFKFEASGYDAEARLFLDGVLQTRTNGNPWETPQLDSHSGNITWGHEGTEALKVGDDRGVDATTIPFASPNSCFYSNWANWSGVVLTPTQIREELFEKGVLPAITISADSEANMQAALDAYADTIRPDWPLAIKIEGCNTGDFELVADNLTFDSSCSLEILYSGVNTLSWVTENGSVLDVDKVSAPYGGTVVIVNAPPVTVHVVDASTGGDVVGATVLLEKTSDGTDIISGVTDSNGEISVNYRYSTDVPVDGKVRRAASGTLYKQASIAGTITSTGVELTAYMVGDE